MAAAMAAGAVGAQTFKEWQDPEVNAVGRAPMRSESFAFRKGEAGTGKLDRKHSANYLSLNGNWKFDWVNDATQRPTGFWKKDFNDKGWATIKVPGMWELNGYGDPIYVNTKYPWDNFFKNNPPTYRRRKTTWAPTGAR